MFSGIVQEYSKSVLKKTKPYGLSLSIKVSKKFTKGLKKGDSIAVNGVCLTVKKFTPGQIDFDVIHESLKLTNLNNILGLRDKFPQYPIGFSDHTEGLSVPTASIALGACLIEKHFTLSKKLKGPDHAASLSPTELQFFVKTISGTCSCIRKLFTKF